MFAYSRDQLNTNMSEVFLLFVRVKWSVVVCYPDELKCFTTERSGWKHILRKTSCACACEYVCTHVVYYFQLVMYGVTSWPA